MNVIKLPSGAKVNKEWKPVRSEFFDVLAKHSPFRRMQEDKRKKEIEKDWKAFSKISKPKEKKEGDI